MHTFIDSTKVCGFFVRKKLHTFLISEEVCISSRHRGATFPGDRPVDAIDAIDKVDEVGLFSPWRLRGPGADALSGSVSHFLDANGLECDAVIHLHGGRYGLVEIKLGGKELVEKGASSLKKLSSKLDTSKMRKPSFLMVLTAVGDVAYRREDGVVVCPISALKP